jgi:hypothetical protein
MVGRGLCGVCYPVEYRAGRLLDWPRPTWRAEDHVDEAELVRTFRRSAEQGRDVLTWRQVAEVLGVKPATLDRARVRVARRARSAA